MKKFLTFVLMCCLVFSSSSTVFATATQWDTSDQANLRYISQSVTSGGSLYTLVNNIYTRVNTISNTLTDINGYLYQNGHSIAYWVEAINSWMQPIYGRLSDILTQSLNIEAVAGLLGSTDVVDGTTVRTPYLAFQSKGVAQYLYDMMTLDNVTGFESTAPGGYKTYKFPAANGGSSNVRINYGTTNWRKNLLGLLNYQFDNITSIYQYTTAGYANTQTALNWTDINSSNTFTGSSAFDTVYKWLSNIQTPVARLSYVLASDERIEAQEKAADNEQAVVDNFIDSSGSGATSTSDIGSVSDLSSGFKDNISTDASVSGIWNIFNSDNFGWFSQETANQLDTTGSDNRTLRSSGSYPTPLLDKQTEDILKYIGGDDND